MRTPCGQSVAALSIFLLRAALLLVPASAASADLTFDERVAAQRAIDGVYWSKRIWPEQNPGPKPTLDEVLPTEALVARVADDLKKSDALDRFWQRPLTAEQLQAEMDRMARETRDAKTLRELFAALGDDPRLIAETLARRSLADRLLRGWQAGDARFQERFETWWERESATLDAAVEEPSFGYTRPEVYAGTGGCTAGTWQSIPWSPPASDSATALWTGAEILLWAGDTGVAATYDPVGHTWTPLPERGSYDSESQALWTGGELLVLGKNQGATYNPTTQTWTPIPATDDIRWNFTAVWTGTYAIRWGGDLEISVGTLQPTNTGDRYHVATQQWSDLGTASAPAARRDHTAVWVGDRMVVWGGRSGSTKLNTGGRYNPADNTWAATTTTGAPTARSSHTAVARFPSMMIVWGGEGAAGALATGAKYDVSANTWTATSTVGAPSARYRHAAATNQAEMIIWGGLGGGNTGARYQIFDNFWVAMDATSAPPGERSLPAAVIVDWVTDPDLFFVWGGMDTTTFEPLVTGALYDLGGPGADTWVPTTVAPSGRVTHNAVWTGAEMLVWGGTQSGSDPDSGERYRPAENSWTEFCCGPEGRRRHTAIWSGTEMIVWGGRDYSGGAATRDDGGRYDPTLERWTATSPALAPLAREEHTTVWTGAEMIVWGGRDNFNNTLGTGARYRPADDTWTPTSPLLAPTVREYHTAVWTGDSMIVWGGRNSLLLDSGSSYDPEADTWTALPPSGTPARSNHTAWWTGSQMLVWGGLQYLNDPVPGPVIEIGGGVAFSPSSGMWSILNGVNEPSARLGHTAVWTGQEMVVWGGTRETSGEYFNDGAAYDPSIDSWQAIATTGAPFPRADHTAVWTGDRMAVWGGDPSRDGSLYCACPAGILIYLDLDDDGIGDSAQVTTSCDGTVPLGYSAIPGDPCPDDPDNDCTSPPDVSPARALSWGPTLFPGGTALRAADLDGDGRSDLVTGRYASTVPSSWLENTGPGSWSPESVDVFGWNMTRAADLDRDGDLDVAGYSPGLVLWWPNTRVLGDLFGTPQIGTGVSGASQFWLHDIDRDGDLDVVGEVTGNASPASNLLIWSANNGQGVFGSSQTEASGLRQGRRGDLVDVDIDGDLDYLAIADSPNAPAWFENTTSGTSVTFGLQQVIGTGQASPLAVLGADIDGDGLTDAVVASASDIVWYRNLPPLGGTFGIQQTLAPNTGASILQAKDVDGDADIDIVLIQSALWLDNRGEGAFVARSLPALANELADVDDDGDLDLLAINDEVYLNQTPHRSAEFQDETILPSFSSGVKAIDLGDIDGDDDLDVFAVHEGSEFLTFQRNLDGQGTFEVPAILAEGLASPTVLKVLDFDRDGDPDVLLGSAADSELRIYLGTSFDHDHISGTAAGIADIDVVDADRDGDLDILAALGAPRHEIVLYEQTSPFAFTEHLIGAGVPGASSVRGADLDRDGDLDVVTTSADDDVLAWYTYTAATDTYSVRKVISTSADGASAVAIGDVDRDGDPDLVCASANDDTIAWYPNRLLEPAGNFGPEQVVSTAIDGARRLVLTDLDADGDLDLLAVAETGDGFLWIENEDGLGTFGPPIAIAMADGASGIVPADIDRDGDLDVVTSALLADTVAWYENTGDQISLVTTSVAPAELAAPFPTAVLSIVATHEGQPGDSSAELAELPLLLERSAGLPLSDQDASDLIDTLSVYRDDGSGLFEPSSDESVASVASFSLSAGALTVPFTDGEADVRLDPGESALFFVVVQLDLDAQIQFPNTLRLTHQVSLTVVEDVATDDPLGIIATPDVSTQTMNAITGDCNGNGVADGLDVRTTTLLETSFEGGLPAGWSFSGQWHATDECLDLGACLDGAFGAYFGQDGACNFNQGTRALGSLVAPPLALPAFATAVTATYCSTYEGEAGSATEAGFDWAWVEGDGQTMTDVVVDNVSFDGDRIGETRIVDLSQFAGDSLTLSWRFDSVDAISNTELGWQIDSVLVQMAPTSGDCNTNEVPDECEADCNGNDVPDGCDVLSGFSADCNGNTRPDECDLVNNDCNQNAVPDDCEPDCTGNHRPDECDIADGIVDDCSGNGVPDECEPDCNGNLEADDCDILDAVSLDCSGNGVPDECEPDCQPNGTADTCDILDATSEDCNGNGAPDECDIGGGVSMDGNSDNVPDECEIDVTGMSASCLAGAGCPTTGGDTVTLTGSGFHNVTPATDRIMFGGIEGSNLIVVDDNTITVLSPVHPPAADCAIETAFSVGVELRIPGRQPIPAPIPFDYEVASLTVPGDAPTIQGGIAAAAPGTCVVVAPGIYTENITFSPLDPPGSGLPVPKAAITLTSQVVDDPSSTRIVGGLSMEPTSPTVVFDGNPSTVVMTGFEITLGNSGVVIRNGAEPRLVENRIDNNFASGDGGGVRVLSGSKPRLERNQIANNFAVGNGGGVAIVGASVILVENNLLENSAGASGGGLYVSSSGTIELSGTRFENNAAGSHGGGLYLAGGVLPLVIAGQDFSGNWAGGSGGGIHVATQQPLTLVTNEIAGNTAQDHGGGIYLGVGSNGTLLLNRIADNRAVVGDGAGLFAADELATVIRSNEVSGNEALGCNARGGGILLGPFSVATVEDNIIKSNVAQRGGGMLVLVKGEPTVRHNVIAFNSTRNACTPPTPDYGPGILVGDSATLPGPGVTIDGNTLHANTSSGSTATGSIHGRKVGLFEPDWINNIVTSGSGWGIYCEGGNTGVHIAYNDLFDNPSGSLHPNCGSPGTTHISADPLYLDPSLAECDFALAANSPARGAGEGGIDLGAVHAEATDASAQPGVPVVDDASNAAITFSPTALGALIPGTEIVIRVVYRDPDVIAGGASTVFVDFDLIPDPGTMPLPGVTLTLPLRAPMPPGKSLILYKEIGGVFVDTGITGVVDASGLFGVFSEVTDLSTFAAGPHIVNGLPGEVSDPNYPGDPFTISKTTEGFGLSWSIPPLGGRPITYRLYQVPLGAPVTSPSCSAPDLGSGTSAVVPELSENVGFIVVGVNQFGEGVYGHDSEDNAHAAAQGASACP